MTIFDYLKDIIVTKSGNLPLDSYVPFLVNRFLSFINPQVCVAINELNSKVFLEDKELHYKMAITLFPKMNCIPKINYIKKLKEQQEEKDPNFKTKIKLLAQKHEISEREVLLLLGECSAN